jgi:tetraacyldisaccharide 4'-kinase
MSADRYLQRVWYGDKPLASFLLLPLSWLFRFIVALRTAGYRIGLLRRHRVARPVIIVGNITVGGTGKTPFTTWLARRLQAQGLRVGIVLRGYGGQTKEWPRHVLRDTAWQEVGDEAALYAASTDAVVVAGPDRVAAASRAIELGAQVVVCDDGLQHYRLQRDAEIVVIDAKRGIGNGRLLPAGPLREPRSRLATADLQVVTRRSAVEHEDLAVAYGTSMAVVAHGKIRDARSLRTHETRELADFRGRPVHAVAGIGHPDAFFAALRAHGLDVREHAYPDHARLTREQICFDDDAPVLMTEKDAVKCAAIADSRHWAVPLQVELSEADEAVVTKLLNRVLDPSH